ncbi:hypothetical protein HK098_002089, partial [Nowakowskiella sp. JEL0407]
MNPIPDTCTINGIHFLLGTLFPMSTWFGSNFVLCEYSNKSMIVPNEKGYCKLEFPGDYYVEHANKLKEIPKSRERSISSSPYQTQERRTSLKLAATSIGSLSRFKRRTSDSSVFSSKTVSNSHIVSTPTLAKTSVLNSLSVLEQEDEESQDQPNNKLQSLQISESVSTLRKKATLNQSTSVLSTTFTNSPKSTKKSLLEETNAMSVPDLSPSNKGGLSPISLMLSSQSGLRIPSQPSHTSSLNSALTDDDEHFSLTEFLTTTSGDETNPSNFNSSTNIKKVGEDASVEVKEEEELDFVNFLHGPKPIKQRQETIFDFLKSEPPSAAIAKPTENKKPVASESLAELSSPVRYVHALGRKFSVSGQIVNESNLADLKWLSGQLKLETVTADGEVKVQTVWATLRDYRFQLLEVLTQDDQKKSTDITLENCFSICEPSVLSPFRFIVIHEDEKFILHATSHQQMLRWVATVNTSASNISSANVLAKKGG